MIEKRLTYNNSGDISKTSEIYPRWSLGDEYKWRARWCQDDELTH